MTPSIRHGAARFAGALTVAALCLGGCGSNSPAAQPAATDVTVPLDRLKLDHVSALTRGRPITGDEWQRWSSLPVEQIVTELVEDPFVGDRVAPAVMFRNNLLRPAGDIGIGGYVLRSTEVAGRPIYHLAGPCKPADVIEVRPWWDLASSVAVCRDAVRPTVWEAQLPDGSRLGCDTTRTSPMMFPRTPCGCGPNLLRCTTPELDQAIIVAAREEVRATTAHVVDTDQPLASLFSRNDTVRSRLIELIYLRDLAEAGRVADPTAMFLAADGWPDQGKLAARSELEPRQHAGVLTAPHMIHHLFDPRQRMRVIYEVMWCGGESAPGATPADVLSLATPDLSMVNRGWEELAHRPICTSCHARLDYGMQFFRGYPAPPSVSWHYLVDADRGESGTLYVRNADDRRGEGPLDPGTFAQLATAQPEFARCMARDVVEYVYGPQVDPAVVDRLAASAPPQKLRFRALMRQAVLEFLACKTCVLSAGAAPPAPASAKIQVGTFLADECTACHSDGADIPSFEGTVTPALRAKILDQVLFGRMPPSGPLPRGRRAQLLAALVEPLARGAAAEAETARRYLAGRADPRGVMPLATAREYLRHLTGSTMPPDDLNTVENALDGRDSMFTPNQAAILAVDSYRTCKQVSPDDPGCVDRVLERILPAPPVEAAR